MINGIQLICFYGPESTGKSTLAARMAERYQTVFVPEVAREIITSSQFTLDDINRIGIAQTRRILDMIPRANRLLFCDTDLITTQIYSQEYLHVVPRDLVALEKQVQYDHYFLFDIDIPWVSDGLRDLGHKREEMFSVFKAALERRKIPFTTVKGTFEMRETFLVDQIDAILRAFPTL